MVTQVKLPAVITATVKYLGNCNSALTMLIVGTILADVKITTIFNKDTAMFSVFITGNQRSDDRYACRSYGGDFCSKI